MAEIDLLRALPKVKRNIQKRKDAKDPAIVAISKQYGEMYFDGPREYGYGGYKYDGRWIPVARDIVAHFNLKPGMRVLDVGCAKGFLVKDLMIVCPGLEVFGLDISLFALLHCEPEVVGRLHLGTAERLPFPDRSFDCVLSLNTVHNFPRPRAIKVMQEIERVSGGAHSSKWTATIRPSKKRFSRAGFSLPNFTTIRRGGNSSFKKRVIPGTITGRLSSRNTRKGRAEWPEKLMRY